MLWLFLMKTGHMADQSGLVHCIQCWHRKVQFMLSIQDLKNPLGLQQKKSEKKTILGLTVRLMRQLLWSVLLSKTPAALLILVELQNLK